MVVMDMMTILAFCKTERPVRREKVCHIIEVRGTTGYSRADDQTAQKLLLSGVKRPCRVMALQSRRHL